MTGEKTNMVVIELTELDAETFREYRRYQDNFETLLKAGVFETKSASVTVDFDKHGVIQVISGPMFNRRTYPQLDEMLP